MMDCSEFLAVYTDYRDQLLDPATSADASLHLERCCACARYDRVVSGGIATLRRLPEITPSTDFLDRLDHRLALADAEPESRSGSGAPVSLVVALSVAIAAAAWVPALRERSDPVRLPPAVAHAPYHPHALPLVFHPGLLPAPGQGSAHAVSRRPAPGFSPYSLLGVADGSARPQSVAANLGR